MHVKQSECQYTKKFSTSNVKPGSWYMLSVVPLQTSAKISGFTFMFTSWPLAFLPIENL